MAVIKEGYSGKTTEIRVNGQDPSRGGFAELWIEQEGAPSYTADGQVSLGHSETLAYITIQEAIALRDELNVAIKEMAGV